MHRRDLRRCLSVGVAPVIRNHFLGFALLVLSGVASASTVTYWYPQSNSAARYGDPTSACRWYAPNYQELKATKNGFPNEPVPAGANIAGCWGTAYYGGTLQFLGSAYQASLNCPFGNTGLTCNASCDAPKVMSGGQCISPPTCDASKGEELVDGACVVTNQCATKKDQATPTWEEFPSAEAYRASCKVSVGGCQVDTCSGSTPTECATDGKTGKMACWGAGKFTGEKSTGTDDATAAQPPKPDPTVTGQNQTCAAPTVSGSTTTYTCITESTATESAGSSCAVGTVNGVQGLHCTKPDYVPEHDSKKREDQVSEVTNPDGSKTTTTTSTTTTTHCAAGACNTTTNVTTTTSGKDANGNPTGTTTTCSGDKCDNPTTPGKDESEEEEEEGDMPAPFAPGDKGDYLPQIGEGQEAPTYSESLDNFTDRVSNAPIVRGLTSITVPSGGTCSMGSAQLFGGSVSFNDFCTMAPQVLAGLRYLFLAIWAWAAIRLFFTA